MKVIKRNGAEVEFDSAKIVSAMERANNACIRRELTDARCEEIIENYKKSPKKDLDRLRTYAAALRVSRQVDRMVFGKRS